jgi:ribonuclease Z
VVSLVSDTEHVPGVLDPNVIELMRDADLVIYDTNFTEEEMERFRGYGHSTWQQGLSLCEAAGAKSFALFHHDKGRTDSQLAMMEKQARSRFKTAFAARDGMVINF